MKIAVIGTGYVGLVVGTCLAEMGNQLVCVDIDEVKIKRLQKGQIPIYESGLTDLVKRNVKEKRLVFTTDIKQAIQESEVVFSAVGTPPAKDHRADLSAVFAVAKSFGRHLNGYKVFVNKSTVPVGTSKKVKQIIAEEVKKRHPFDVVDNPEFLREGTAVKDFINPDRIVVGAENKRSREVMARIYAPLVRAGRPLNFTSVASAEIVKYGSNAFLATKISFINEMANFCEKAGGDVKEVAKGIGLDSRIGPRFLHAGIGWGGSCFPKDVNALIQTGREYGYEFRIIQAAAEVNQRQKYLLVKKLKKVQPNLKGKKIAIWGLSFKPKTDDMREAPALVVIRKLQEEGALIQVFDPVAMENARKMMASKNVKYFKTSYEALKDADVLLVLTEWDEFRSVDFAKMKKLMKGNWIFDGRNIYDPKEMKKAGFKYFGIGLEAEKA